jgi:TPR repeat protein
MEIKRSAAGAVLIFALGFVLGVNSERLEQSVADRASALGFAASFPDTGAAYASYEKGDHATALRLARPLAEQGDARAQTLLGSIYYSGRGAPRDDLEATNGLASPPTRAMRPPSSASG